MQETTKEKKNPFPQNKDIQLNQDYDTMLNYHLFQKHKRTESGSNYAYEAYFQQGFCPHTPSIL